MKRIMPPKLETIIDDLRDSIPRSMNCIQIGRVSKVNLSKQTVEVQIQIRHLDSEGASVAVPVLVDCPFFVLQGGGAYLDLPVSVGDYCIVLFNDQNIDNWYVDGNVSDPANKRAHDLSDGIALIGINPSCTVRSIDGSSARFIHTGKIILQAGSTIELNGNSKAFVTYAALNSALQGLVTAINAAFSSKLNGSGSAATLTLDISGAATTTVKTGG